MLKKLLFTHTDLDGAGCRILYEVYNHSLVKGEDYDVIHVGKPADIDEAFKNAMNRIDINTEITFGDISPLPTEFMEQVKADGYHIEIYDHHETAFPIQQIFENAVIIPKNPLGKMECGTSLMYIEYVNRAEYDKVSYVSDPKRTLLPTFVENVRSYDTYEFKETGNIQARKFNILFFLLGMNSFCDHYIKRLTKEDITDEDNELFLDIVMPFIEARMAEEQAAIDKFTIDQICDLGINGKNIGFTINTFGANFSELANQWLAKHPEYDALVNFSLPYGTFSFRTVKDDINLAQDFALVLGGGGHPKAAGASLDEETGDQIFSILCEYLLRINDKNKHGA